MTTTMAPVPAAATLTVSEVAAQSGVAPSAVRFYEKHGVITAVRTAGNQRRFDDSAACRILVTKVAQRVGLTVREIAELFRSLPAAPAPDDWGAVAVRLISEAEERVAHLKAQLAAMESGTMLCEIGLADATGWPPEQDSSDGPGTSRARAMTRRWSG